MGVKISGLTAKGAALAATDLVEIAQSAGGGLYTSRSVTGANIKTFAQTGLPTEIQVAASDETTALTTGTAKVTFRMPYAMTVTAVRASLSTAQASGSILSLIHISEPTRQIH
jgi:hypothetical protein